MEPIHLSEIPIEIKQYVGTIHSIRFPRQGYTSNVGIIDTSSGMYALKRTKGEILSSWLHKEVTVTNLLDSGSTLPIPKVKRYLLEKNKGQSWALLGFFEGETLRTALFNEENEEKRREMIFNFGTTLSQIHLTPCPKEFIHEQQPWLDQMLVQAEWNLKNSQVDGSESLLQRIKRNRPNEYKQTLIHGDYTIDNVLVKNGIITGVIDWGGGAYGDPRYDVSIAIRPKPNVFENEVDQQIFFEGYGGKIINKWEYDYFVNGLYEFF
ncbi:aminoglycoside phosphotransferase family protein [Neobacillus rhizosphaerae]|uniref:aminoglycoside phosphotransferase family protein n=1 Tax=Neobacillus rhizosphaerae TaxID=2880965 RepID=UPI003D2DCF5A